MANKSSKGKQSIANRTYQYSDYYTNDQTSKGLAETHEQVSDTYMEGTVDQEVNSTNNEHHKGNIPRNSSN
ncbi:YozQ family protein [Oceanobacillus bengalensis]|uniref:DUF4025 domain-containing protein n=1 Tax=Oceanobacillus bengalensis TaxID=1435466 RepID=A0A494YYC0_9BACI|nr:YozQ family protein [Oceanobacillus bengalensis]RKQ15230.1 DUF4025 domain-containing protein [Oceanobacillus bengalensis]